MLLHPNHISVVYFKNSFQFNDHPYSANLEKLPTKSKSQLNSNYSNRFFLVKNDCLSIFFPSIIKEIYADSYLFTLGYGSADIIIVSISQDQTVYVVRLYQKNGVIYPIGDIIKVNYSEEFNFKIHLSLKYNLLIFPSSF